MPARRLDCPLDADTAAAMRGVRRVTWVGLFVSLALSVLKAAAGALAHSQALVADAAHSLSDLATDVVVLVGVRYWSAPADADHPHGHRKLEALVTLFIAGTVAAVGAGIGWNAVATLVGLYGEGGDGGAERAAPGPAAALAALASVVAKEALYRWTAREGRRLKSSAVIANAWHHRSDALSSVPVVLVVAADMAGRRHGLDLAFLDPVAAVLVAAMIARAALRIARDAFASLVDAGAGRRATARLRGIALATPDVRVVHALRTRYLGPEGLAVDLHVLVDGALSVRRGHAISEEVRRRLLDGDAQVVEVLVHLEPDDAAERDRE